MKTESWLASAGTAWLVCGPPGTAACAQTSVTAYALGCAGGGGAGGGGGTGPGLRF